MGKIKLIIAREYLSRVRKKSFIVMTLLGPILIAGFISLAVWMSLSDEVHHTVLVVDKTEGHIMNRQMTASNDINYFYSSEDLPDEVFQESDYSLMLYVNEKIVVNNKAILYYKKTPSFNIKSVIEYQLEKVLESYKLELNEISPEAYAHVKTQVNLVSHDIDEDTDPSVSDYKQELAAVGFFFAILIYMFIFMYGVQVMRGVIEEKTNRIVEVLISSVKPFQLMMGKILGIAMVGFTQFILWILLTGAITIAVQTFIFKDQVSPEMMMQNQMSTQLMQSQAQEILMESAQKPNEVFELISRINFPLMLGMFLFYFVGGYLLYSSLFAAVGAAVDSETDTQQFMIPVSFPLIFGFFIAQMTLQNPEGSAAVWFSIIPLTSPVVMMVRVAMGFDTETIWQLYLSMALLVVGFLVTTWLAGKIYRTGILMYGKKVSYKELFKWLFYK
ncbi:MAG: ABC-2 type transport system permease protein [Flavobacteriales bacterium]|jgi:ABC-2 type transport system permease protein